MAFVVAVAQQKGGSGKSTVAANLAAVLAGRGSCVPFFDTDPQGSVTRWHEEQRRHAGRVAPLLFERPSAWREPIALDKLRRDRVAAALTEIEVPLLEQCLGSRAHFASAFLDGLALTEVARSTAAAEPRALASAVAALSPGF